MAPVLGTSAGAYQLQEIVASDALGTVYRAQDERTGRQALVRFLQPLAGDPAALRRFKIELPAIAGLHHPGIVRVEGWGEWDGVPYVVTPLVPAERLSDLLAAGRRLDPRAAVRVLRGAAAALDYAHRSGVVHGGLEPATVLVAADGTARLCDFGLALVANASASGTGPDADVSALAAIARELLPGSPAVDAVLQRGLAPDPQRRWQACGAMVEALEAALSGGQVAAVAEPVQARFARLLHWRWIGLGAAGVLLLVLVVSLAAHLLRPSPALALSPMSVRAGDVVAVTGRNLPSGQPGTVVIEGRPAPAAQFTTDSRGAFSVSITVPEGMSGDATVEACWGGSCPISQVLHVLSPPSPPPTALPTPVVVQVTPTPTPGTRRVAPSISLNRLTPRRGQTVRIVGRGFDPQQQYQVVLDQNGRQWVLQQPTSPDGSGGFTDAVQIPGDARRGLATVVACVYPPGQVAACARQPLVIAS